MCASSLRAKQRLYAIYNTTIGLVKKGCLALELAKKQIKPDTIFIPDACATSRCIP
jgi:hypothetical protein